MTRTIALRADASRDIGLGHVKRCIALAHALDDAGVATVLVYRDLGIDFGAELSQAGIPGLVLPAPQPIPIADSVPHAAWAAVPWHQDAEETSVILKHLAVDWLIVDHYAFDARWHERIRSRIRCRIGVIDDLGDRPLDCDVLIDHNHAADHRSKYGENLPAKARLFCGPRFALLGRKFLHAPRYIYKDSVASIGIFMGGVDAHDISSMALQACRAAGFMGQIEVVTTHANPNIPSLRHAVASAGNATLTLDLPDLSEFFARHDLQIGASGGATWERLCIGSPTLAVVTAENQRQVLLPLLDMGVVSALRSIPPNLDEMTQAVADLLADGPARRSMSLRARELVDGNGPRRIAHGLIDL